jgi:REP element-mobilizing transposase RayT
VKESPHSSNLRLHRWSDAAATFSVTKSLHPKKPALNEQAREIIVSAFEFAVKEQRIYLRAFVVMPDHWHILFALIEPWTLPKFIHNLMSYVGRKTSVALKQYHTAWQDGYYDTHVKTARQFVCCLLHRTESSCERVGRESGAMGSEQCQANRYCY